MKCIVFLLLFWSTAHAAVNILKHVTVIFRHGDRNKLFDIPGDLHNSLNEWPGGLGELNHEGKLRLYMMGQFFRDRYIATGFAPENYTPDVYVVKSTDVDRAIMSGAAYLAGLLPPKHSQVWNPAIYWQPIPIHTIPTSEDATIAMERNCTRYTYLYRLFLRSDTMKTNNQKAKKLYKYFKDQTNTTVQSIIQLARIYDTFLVEKQMHYSLPSYANPTFLKQLKNIANVFYGFGCYTPELARLKAGPLVNEIIQNFYDDNTSGKHRYRIYSGHDYTIGNILKALDAYNNIKPPYASAVIFELRNINSKYYVNLLYKNTTDSFAPPEKLKIRGCKFNCPFQKFLSLTANLNIDPTTWAHECDNLEGIDLNMYLC